MVSPSEPIGNVKVCYTHDANMSVQCTLPYMGVILGHMKNAIVGVLIILSKQHPRVHSSHDLVSFEE